MKNRARNKVDNQGWAVHHGVIIRIYCVETNCFTSFFPFLILSSRIWDHHNLLALKDLDERFLFLRGGHQMLLLIHRHSLYHFLCDTYKLFSLKNNVFCAKKMA